MGSLPDGADEIVASTGNQDVVVRKLDLASLSSVREFSKQILESEPRLDVLINNAGVASTDDKKTKDNILVGMQANHFGHFLLTNLLLGLLKKSAPSRIVTVSSVMHRISNLSVDNLNGEKSFNWITLYPNSKLANMLTSIQLAKILDGTGVTSNCLHPGVIVTGIWRHVPPGLRQVLLFFLRMVLKDVVEGAQTTIHLAVSEQVEGVTGKYFAECKEVTPSAKARDEGLARKLWEKSEQIVQLTPQETVL
uniref:Retinol dehydrogenase 14 n=1 Tax=Timema cristinae TaxID=61476 RepID=A0A7R9DIP3_TIMCR|nr:unnamed protein product [Timema cristinae]